MTPRRGPLCGSYNLLPLFLALCLYAPPLLLVWAQATPGGSVQSETKFCNRFVRYGGLQCDEYVVSLGAALRLVALRLLPLPRFSHDARDLCISSNCA